MAMTFSGCSTIIARFGPKDSESQVHSRPDRLRDLGYRVRILTLRFIPHDQQVTLAEIPAPSFACHPMPEDEPSPISKADGGYEGSWAQLWFVVTVVAHGVGAIPIEIGQAGVQGHTQLAAKAVPQLSQGFQPRCWLVHDAGVAVSAVSDPRAEPRCGHGAAVQRDGVLLPGDLILEHLEQPAGIVNPAWVIVDAPWRCNHDQYVKPAATSRLSRRCRWV